jgi:serine/threonine protein phosphatase PrpC
MNDTTIRRPIKWLSSSETNVGVVRTVNEDSLLEKPEIGLWAVADGMGGHEAGDVASNMIVSSLNELERKMQLNDYVTAIEDKVIDVNDRLLEYAEIMLDGRIIGSTVAILLIQGRVGVCMWAGDSRLYRYRTDELEQITFDHSQISELLKQGSITIDEAENHPEANVITRAIGTSTDLFVDIDVFDVRVGDIYLLCSDGLYNSVAEESITETLQDDEIDTIAHELIEKSLTNQANDNVSAIVVKGVPRNA